MVSMWLAYLAWIYVADIPSGTTFITLTNTQASDIDASDFVFV